MDALIKYKLISLAIDSLPVLVLLTVLLICGIIRTVDRIKKHIKNKINKK